MRRKDYRNRSKYIATLRNQKGRADTARGTNPSIAATCQQSVPDNKSSPEGSTVDSVQHVPSCTDKQTTEGGLSGKDGKASSESLADRGNRQLTIPRLTSELLAQHTGNANLQVSQLGLPSFLDQRNASSHQGASQPPARIRYSQDHERYPDLLLQPDLDPISQKNLTREVDTIYAGLAMVEDNCIHVDRTQAAAVQHSNTKLPPDHWQALVSLHRTLLYEHHDFFLASHHPSGSAALQHRAATLPRRMWKHGIMPLLELLRMHLPDTKDFLLQFIYLAYNMIALLYETVTAFEDRWIECLGDLARYRMAVENEDIRDRHTWAEAARYWYTKAADKNPITGRLYIHLAILARPSALQQMYYYSRSLTSVRPFGDARKSILHLLDPILGRTTVNFTHALPIDASFIKAHGLQLLKLSVKEGQSSEDFLNAKADFLNSLSGHIGLVTAKWKDQGVWIAITNIAGWFDYGVNNDPLLTAVVIDLLWKAKKSASMTLQSKRLEPSLLEPPNIFRVYLGASKFHEDFPRFAERLTFKNARVLFNDTFALALRRVDDKNVLPHVNIKLAFTVSLASNPLITNLFDDLPWTDLVGFLNALLKAETLLHETSPTSQAETIHSLLADCLFPAEGERPDELPLPEDYHCRGLIWTYRYFPKYWFERQHDEEKHYLEHASTVQNRIHRVLRLGYALAKYNRWLSFDSGTRTFWAISRVSGYDCTYEWSWYKRLVYLRMERW